jgi:hypothetical protein
MGPNGVQGAGTALNVSGGPRRVSGRSGGFGLAEALRSHVSTARRVSGWAAVLRVGCQAATKLGAPAMGTRGEGPLWSTYGDCRPD